MGSQPMFDLRLKHVVLGMISMWWTTISCAEVVTRACLMQSWSEEEEESELEVAHTLLGLAEWKVSNAISPVVTRTSH